MRVKALVVEDSTTVRYVTMKLLRHSGLAEFEFSEAADGVEGLRLFESEDFDMVFSDWNMPRMNGIDFIARVRAKPTALRVPIVMLTSERSMGKVMQVMESGQVDAYVTKPFNDEMLREKLSPVFEEMVRMRKQTSKPKPGFLRKLLGR